MPDSSRPQRGGARPLGSWGRPGRVKTPTLAAPEAPWLERSDRFEFEQSLSRRRCLSVLQLLTSRHSLFPMSDAAPVLTTCAMCGGAASPPAMKLLACSGDCRVAAYCSDRDCQDSHRAVHAVSCQEAKTQRLYEVLVRRGYENLCGAIRAGDSTAVYELMNAGAALRFAGGWTIMHLAAQQGRCDIMAYVNKMEPELTDEASERGTTPLMIASQNARRFVVVLQLARLGCSLSGTDEDGLSALDYAGALSRPSSTWRVLKALERAGGWRPYVAACRMAYVRIRHKVSSTYLVLPETFGGGPKLRELLHFMFGKNKVLAGGGQEEARRTRAQVRRSAMLTMPDAVFTEVCRFLGSE